MSGSSSRQKSFRGVPSERTSANRTITRRSLGSRRASSIREHVHPDYEEFSYYDIAISEGEAAFEAAVSWKTTALASTQIRFKEVGASRWITLPEVDTAPRVLVHERSQ